MFKKNQRLTERLQNSEKVLYCVHCFTWKCADDRKMQQVSSPIQNETEIDSLQQQVQ